MKYSYEIIPRPVELGGGWRLRLLEDAEEVGGGVFPVIHDDPQAKVAWWSGCTEAEQARWLAVAKSTVPADAWTAYQLAETYADAETAAYEWLESREVVDQSRMSGTRPN